MSSVEKERGREVRERLLSAAVELIPARGWAAVSTRILAEHAGVSPSVVHYHFDSLPALLNEAVVGVMGRLTGEAEALLGEARGPTELVDGLAMSLSRYTGTDPSSLLAIEAYLAASRDPRLRAAIGGVVSKFRRRLGKWLGAHRVAAPDETAAALVAVIDGLLLQRGLGVGVDPKALPAVLHRLVRHERNRKKEGTR